MHVGRVKLRIANAIAVLIAVVFVCSSPENRVSATRGEKLEIVNVSQILDSLCDNYDKRVRPNYGGQPVVVGVTMYVISISSLSEVEMDFTLDFYFRQVWSDSRLTFKKHASVETLSVGSEFIKNIWVPDTFFVNEKKSYFHVATSNNEFIRIHQSGAITRSLRLTVTASCPMDLQYFPMDRQLCRIEIESFGYTMNDIQYKWHEGPNSVGISPEVSLPQFKVLGYRQRAMDISLTTGNYSRLYLEIQFERSMGYYMIQIYIPSCLIVVISWVSFWLHRTATPARVSLGVTTVLTMTTLMSSTNAALPKISYVKSIDVYLGFCFLKVFASLLEYATVGYLAKRIQMRKQQYVAAKKAERKAAAAAALLSPPVDIAGPSESVRTIIQVLGRPDARQAQKGTVETAFNRDGSRNTVAAPLALIDVEADVLIPKNLNRMFGVTPADIDKYSRIIFPVCFICFNITYWTIYLYISDVVADDLVLLDNH